MFEQDTSSAWQQRNLYRIDTNLVSYNLSLSYEERLRQHQNSLDMVLSLQQAGRDYYAELEQPSHNPSRK